MAYNSNTTITPLMFPKNTGISEVRSFSIKVLNPNKDDSIVNTFNSIARTQFLGSPTSQTIKTVGDVSKTFAEAMSRSYDENNSNIAADTGSIVMHIILPMPNSFRDSQSHDWNNTSGTVSTLSQNFVSAITPANLTKGANAIVKLGADVLSIFGKYGTVAGEVIKSGSDAAKQAVDSLYQGVTLDSFVGDLSSKMGFRKPMVDPNYFQNYVGSTPRTFSLSWELIPRSADEAEEIFKIVMALKMYSAPTATDNITMLAPHFFSLSVGNKSVSEYLNAMLGLGNAVIKDLSLDFGADGAMQMYTDGFPKQMNLSITFAEMRLTTANHYTTLRNDKTTSAQAVKVKKQK